MAKPKFRVAGEPHGFKRGELVERINMALTEAGSPARVWLSKDRKRICVTKWHLDDPDVLRAIDLALVGTGGWREPVEEG